MRPPKYPIRDDLFCPACGHNGMRQKADTDSAPSGRPRYVCQGCKTRTTRPAYAPVQILPKTRIADLRAHKFFVITSAVNDTPIVAEAHETFKRIAAENNGCYLIVPGVYKNPDMSTQGALNSYTWPTEILPHLCNVNVKLNDNIVIKGETRIQYTVINPLAGLNHAGSHASEIYAHPQIAMEMIATPRHHMPKMLHTTGTISRPNYGGSVRAQKASFHHSLSAVIVEIEGNKFWHRVVHFDGTGAYDLDRYYTPKKVTRGKAVAGIVYGDVHVQALDPKIDALLERVTKKLKPEYKVFHDLHDQNVGSHHSADDVIGGLAHAMSGKLKVSDELKLAVDFLDRQGKAYLVDSNHHRHLDRWFNRFKPKQDLLNAPLYFELSDLLCKDLAAGGDGNLFRCYVQRYSKAEVHFINPDDTFLIRGVDCSQHGDRGPNGSRGTARAFAASGHKTMIGHGHTPRIEKGCYQVGVMSPNLEYAKGLSSWCNTHGIIYDNGKRALFNIVNGKLSPTMRVL